MRAGRHDLLHVLEGDVAALVSNLLSTREISPGDLARVKRLIAAHEAGRRTPDDDA